MDKTEREAWEKELDRLEVRERGSYSYKAPNSNLIIFALSGGFILACVSIVAIFLHKSDNDRCKC